MDWLSTRSTIQWSHRLALTSGCLHILLSDPMAVGYLISVHASGNYIKFGYFDDQIREVKQPHRIFYEYIAMGDGTVAQKKGINKDKLQ